MYICIYIVFVANHSNHDICCISMISRLPARIRPSEKLASETIASKNACALSAPNEALLDDIECSVVYAVLLEFVPRNVHGTTVTCDSCFR